MRHSLLFKTLIVLCLGSPLAYGQGNQDCPQIAYFEQTQVGVGAAGAGPVVDRQSNLLSEEEEETIPLRLDIDFELSITDAQGNPPLELIEGETYTVNYLADSTLLSLGNNEIPTPINRLSVRVDYPGPRNPNDLELAYASTNFTNDQITLRSDNLPDDDTLAVANTLLLIIIYLFDSSEIS